MHCRRFRAQHASFLDDTLSGDAMDAMRGHLQSCGACAREDATVRRALMLVRNLQSIEVSPDFSTRLAARLAREARPSAVGQGHRWGWLGVGVGVAAALVLLVSPRPRGPAPVVAHRAIVVMPPAVPAEPLATPAMFGTVASSLPVYPAMLMAQRATEYFVAAHVRAVSFQATR